MRVNADSLLIRAATTSTLGTLNDLTTDLIMANNNNSIKQDLPVKSAVIYIYIYIAYIPLVYSPFPDRVGLPLYKIPSPCLPWMSSLYIHLSFQNLLQDILSYKHVIAKLIQKGQTLSKSNEDSTISKQISVVNKRYETMRQECKVRTALFIII